MNTILKDIRFALRGLIGRPGFAAIVVVVLGLGIGSTTAIFSIVDALVLRSLPYPQSERLVLLREINRSGNQVAVAEANFLDIQSQSKSFESLAISAGSFPLVVNGGREAQRSKISIASSDFFKAMGVQPMMGRTFAPEEEKFGGPIAAIVSFSYWQNSLGSRSDFDRTTLNIDGVKCNVVGVMPPAFDYPAQTEIWITRNTEPVNQSRTAHNWPVIGRLKQGTTIEQARAEVSLIAAQLQQRYGKEMDAVDFALVPLQSFLTRNIRQGLWLLLGSVGILLLVACANFSNLLLGQLMNRHREFTVRCALGASARHITQQVLIENLLLVAPATVAGVVLAKVAIRFIAALDEKTLPRINSISIDGRVLLFVCGLSVAIAVVLSFLPGLRLASRDLVAGLKAGGRGQSHQSRTYLRSALVVGQVGLTVILLVAAGLLTRSFLNLLKVDPGFNTESAVAMTLALPTTITPAEDEQLRQFYVQLLSEIKELPGVTAVGGINALPLADHGTNGTFLINNDPSQRGQAEYRVASGGYFPAMRIPLLRGRLFDANDKVDSQHVALISDSLARHWPNGDPIGQRIQFGNMDSDKHLLEIVGVVGDVRDATIEREPEPTVYAYSLQRPQWWQVARLSIVVRAQKDPQTLIPALRSTVQSLRKDSPMSFATLEQVFSSSFDSRRFTLVLFGVFGGVALLITVIGLYGMLAYTVAERTREMGIRMALGAQRSSVLKLVISHGLKLAILGITIGVIGALALTRLMANLLFGITPKDSLTLAAVVVTLLMVSLVACFVPARRATRVDPLVALRDE